MERSCPAKEGHPPSPALIWEKQWPLCPLSESILGDPGAVSRVGRKGATKVFKYGQKSPWVPTLTELFSKLQADAGSWLGTKNALYYCAQSANSFSWVLFVISYTTANVLPHLPGSFTKLARARETVISTGPNQKRRNYRWVEKTVGMLSTGAIHVAPRIFFLWLITMYRKFKEVKDAAATRKSHKQQLDKAKQQLCTCITLFCAFPALPSTARLPVKMLNFMFCEGRKQAMQNSFSSWTWIWLIQIQLQKSSLAFEKVSVLE